MKKELRDRATQFMEAYLGLCKTYQCSIEPRAEEVEGIEDGIEVFVWPPGSPSELWLGVERATLTERIAEDEE